MPAPRNHYELLGLPRTASLEDIKKRYRELAREYHPDVNRDKPDAARMFSKINAAYRTLSHPDERATYDADLVLSDQRQAARDARTHRDTFPGTATAPPPRANRPVSSGPRNAPGGVPPRSAAPPSNADTSRLVAEAQAAFVRGKFVEARGAL